MLTNEIKNMLMERFPEIKLSYNKNIYRKVYADYYSIIPKGPKAIMWFTYIHKKNICLILLLDNKDNIKSIESYAMCFDNKLSYGTVVYGTFIKTNKTNIFCFEDLHYYKGKCVERYKAIKQLELFQQMFTNEISQNTYSIKFIKPVLPLMDTNYNILRNKIERLPYNVYGIKYIRNHTTIGIEKVNIELKREAIFKVKADVHADIYKLYCIKDNTDYNLGIAMITSYKKSVLMNSLFRNIKENINLDLLEESDEDEEFENIDPNKFVNLEKELIMKCIYNNKFKKWEPTENLLDNIKYSTYNEVHNI